MNLPDNATAPPAPIDAAIPRKAHGRWAVAMTALMGELTVAAWRHVPVEYENWWVVSWIFFVVGSIALIRFGWRSDRIMRAVRPWMLHVGVWLGLVGCFVAICANLADHSPGYYYYRVSVRQIGGAVDQFCLENPHRIFVTYDDLIGPVRYIKALNANVGENYHEMFPFLVDGPELRFTCTDGRTLILFKDNYVPFVLDRHGQPIALYSTAETRLLWQDQMAIPDGVKVEELKNGRRYETTYHGGIPDGPLKVYEAGHLIAEANYVKGRLAGPCWHYLQDGTRYDESLGELSDTGRQKLLAKDYAGALADFTHELEFYGCAQTYLDRGDARLGLGDITGAMADFKLAPAARQPNEDAGEIDRAVASRLAKIYSDRGHQEARENSSAETAMDLKAGETAILEDAQASWRKRDYPGTIAALNDSVRLAPDQAVLELRGDARSQLGQSAGALDDYAAALKRTSDPFDKAALNYKRAHLLRLAGKLPSAIEEFRQLSSLYYIGKRPDCFDGAFWIYFTRVEGGAQAYATKDLTAFLARMQTSRGTEWEQQIVRYILGQITEEQLEAEKNHGPRFICIGFLYPFFEGMVHRRDHDLPGAADRFRRALAAESSEDDWWLDYAEARRALQRTGAH